jgi:hypothetical protein
MGIHLAGNPFMRFLLRSAFRSASAMTGVTVALLGCSSSEPSTATGDAAVSPDGTVIDGSACPSSGCDSGGQASKDGASGDSGDAGVPLEDCTGLTYCDDFETYDAAPVKGGQMLGPWSANYVGSNASVTVDSVRAYTGKQSFHVRFPPSQSGSYLTQAAAADAGLIAGNKMFGRSMFYFVVDPGAADGGLEPDGGVGLPISVHADLFTTSGTTSTADGGTSSEIAATGQALYLNYRPPGTFERALGDGIITGNAWHCLQWEFDGSGDASTNQAQIWLDGQLVASTAQAPLWVAATPWQTFNLGFWVNVRPQRQDAPVPMTKVVAAFHGKAVAQ